MPKVLESERFSKTSPKLPKAQQEKLAILLELLKHDPNNFLLHTKRLTGVMSNRYSFRITRDWRVVFEYQNESTILLLNVAHRNDVYRKI